MQEPNIAPPEASPPAELTAPPPAEGAAIDVTPRGTYAPNAAATTDARREGMALIERATALPPAVRERLLAAVRSEDGGDASRVSLAAVIGAIEGALPGFLRGNAEAAPAVHPSGDAFFSGAAGELSDSEAESLAQQQLQRAGLLRGQRVRTVE